MVGPVHHLAHWLGHKDVYNLRRYIYVIYIYVIYIYICYIYICYIYVIYCYIYVIYIYAYVIIYILCISLYLCIYILCIIYICIYISNPVIIIKYWSVNHFSWSITEHGDFSAMDIRFCQGRTRVLFPLFCVEISTLFMLNHLLFHCILMLSSDFSMF